MIFIAIGILVISFLFYKLLSRGTNSSHLSYENESFDYDVAIVGSGILGSALATVLARDGRKVVVVERDMKMPERFSGEFLHPRGIKVMKDLGLEECLKDIGTTNSHGFIIRGNRKIDEVVFPIPLDNDGVGALTLNNGRLVMSLRKAAMSEENVTYIEGKVIRLKESNNIITGVIYETENGHKERTIKAKLTIVADGCFSNLRKYLTSRKPEHLSNTIVGICKPFPLPRQEYTQIVLADTDLVILYKLDNDLTRIFIDLKQKIPMKDMKYYLINTLSPQLPESFRGPFLEAIDTISLRSMPNRYLPGNPVHHRGLMVLGDALNMRHPITGIGMTVAFCDIQILRNLLSKVDDLSDYKTLLNVSKEFFKLRKYHSFVNNCVAQMFFKVLNADGEWMRTFQTAYLQFLKFNDKNRQEIVLLVSALKTDITLLLSNLISAALYAILLPLKENSEKSIIKSIYCSMRIIGVICKDLLPIIWTEAKTFI